MLGVYYLCLDFVLNFVELELDVPNLNLNLFREWCLKLKLKVGVFGIRIQPLFGVKIRMEFVVCNVDF